MQGIIIWYRPTVHIMLFYAEELPRKLYPRDCNDIREANPNDKADGVHSVYLGSGERRIRKQVYCDGPYGFTVRNKTFQSIHKGR